MPSTAREISTNEGNKLKKEMGMELGNIEDIFRAFSTKVISTCSKTSVACCARKGTKKKRGAEDKSNKKTV